MGVSTYDATDKDVVFLANHNAYVEQEVTLKLTREAKPKLFNRSSGDYEAAPVKDGTFSFKLEPAGGAIVLFE